MLRYLKHDLKYNTLRNQEVNVWYCKNAYWNDLDFVNDNNIALLPDYKGKFKSKKGAKVFPHVFTYSNKNGRLYSGCYSLDGADFFLIHYKGLPNVDENHLGEYK